MRTDAKKIGKRLKTLREYSGLSRREFGELFRSKESTVYQWEYGYCIPRTTKLMNISAHFGISLDCILCGRAEKGNALEKLLCGTEEPDRAASFYSANRIIGQLNALPDQYKERLIGYLDALSRETGR